MKRIATKAAATWLAIVFHCGMVMEGFKGCAAVLAFMILF
jgi:hypothetical protein